MPGLLYCSPSQCVRPATHTGYTMQSETALTIVLLEMADGSPVIDGKSSACLQHLGPLLHRVDGVRDHDALLGLSGGGACYPGKLRHATLV